MLAAIAGFSGISAGLSAVMAPERRSVWDGVYSAEQATRGATLYGDNCARCHASSLTGSESAPALVGDQFNANWDGVMLVELFDRIRSSMPQDRPGSLSRQQTADILAYMLSVGQFPAAETPLDSQAVSLEQIRYESIRPTDK